MILEAAVLKPLMDLALMVVSLTIRHPLSASYKNEWLNEKWSHDLTSQIELDGMTVQEMMWWQLMYHLGNFQDNIWSENHIPAHLPCSHDGHIPSI